MKNNIMRKGVVVGILMCTPCNKIFINKKTDKKFKSNDYIFWRD